MSSAHTSIRRAVGRYPLGFAVAASVVVGTGCYAQGFSSLVSVGVSAGTLPIFYLIYKPSDEGAEGELAPNEPVKLRDLSSAALAVGFWLAWVLFLAGVTR